VAKVYVKGSSFAKVSRPPTPGFSISSCAHTFFIVNVCNLWNMTRDGLREAESRKGTMKTRAQTSPPPSERSCWTGSLVISPCFGLAPVRMQFILTPSRQRRQPLQRSQTRVRFNRSKPDLPPNKLLHRDNPKLFNN